MRRASRTIALVLAAAASAAGCYSWRPQPVTTEGARPLAFSGPVRVLRTDGTRVVLEDARVVADSVAGYAPTRTPWGSVDRPTVAIAVSDVRRVDELRMDRGRSVALAAVGGLVCTAALLGLFVAGF